MILTTTKRGEGFIVNKTFRIGILERMKKLCESKKVYKITSNEQLTIKLYTCIIINDKIHAEVHRWDRESKKAHNFSQISQLLYAITD